jgi:hypothetical protein
MTRTPISIILSAALIAATLVPQLATARPHHNVVVDHHRGHDPYWGRPYDGKWGKRYVARRHTNIVYYDRRPDVVYVSGRAHRYYYHPQRRVYYYRDTRGNQVVLGAALGAVGLAAILSASR